MGNATRGLDTRSAPRLGPLTPMEREMLAAMTDLREATLPDILITMDAAGPSASARRAGIMAALVTLRDRALVMRHGRCYTLSDAGRREARRASG